MGSLAVFLPSAYYLAQPQITKYKTGSISGHGGHGDHGGHEDHEEHSEESGSEGEGKQEDSEEDKSAEEGSEDQGGDEEGKKGHSSSESDTEDNKETPNTSEDEGSDEKSDEKPDGKPAKNEAFVKGEGTSVGGDFQFKGATNATEDGAQSHTEKHIPDAKGFNKRRIESHYGKNLGEAQNDEQSAENEDLVSIVACAEFAMY